MGIRKKVLLIVGAVVSALVAFLAAASYVVVTGRFARLEVTRTELQVQRVQNELNNDLTHLEITLGDWAPWDDTYRFVEDLNPEYVQNNLVDTTLANLRLNCVLYFNKRGELVYEKYFELDPEKPVVFAHDFLAAVKNNSRLLAHKNEKSRLRGILMTPSMPYLVASQPIVNSDFTGPIRGTLIMARALDNHELEKISTTSMTSLSITDLASYKDKTPSEGVSTAISRPGEIAVVPLTANSIAGHVTISDLSAKPVLLLSIVRDRDIYRYGLVTWRQNVYVLFVFALGFIVLLLSLLDRIVLGRLRHLTENVNAIADSADRSDYLDIRGKDEISQLAGSINTMLKTIRQNHAEKILNEQYLSELLNSIHCGIMVVDVQDHKVVDINEAGLALFQGNREDIIGKQCHHLVCPNAAGKCPIIDLGKAIEVSERTLLRSDGSTLPIIKSVAKIERLGRSYLIESFFDISNLKKAEANLRMSEERYRRFFEEDITGDFIISVDGRIVECNPAFAKMFGYADPSEIKTSMPPEDYLSKKDRRTILTRLRQERRLEEIELAFHHRSGKKIYCIGNLIGQFDGAGTLREVKGYLFDDTKRIQLEKDLRQAQKMEAIGTLAGGIAHDFNNILAGIMGYTEIALSELPKESRTADRLNKVLKSANRAKDLVHQILAFSRQNEGETHPLSPKPIIKEVVKLMRASLPANIDIYEQITSGACVMANPVQIHQMIMNLCTNAAYAMKKTGGSLTISAADTHLDESFTSRYSGVRQGDYLCISIKDTGPGVSPAIIDRIFDPFFTTKDKNEATGLGLSVVHGIVSKLKGVVTVDSSPQGATFNIYLPIAVEISAKDREMKAEPLPTGTETVVFIDDEELLVEVGIHMLTSLGYHAAGYSESLKALEYIRTNADKVDLVITDMAMPNLTGLALARQLKELLPNLPVIICSGYSEEISAETAVAMGADGYVMKPMVIKELADKIREVLNTGR